MGQINIGLGYQLHSALKLPCAMHLDALLFENPAWLQILMADHLETRRQQEFGAGRQCARRALARAGEIGRACLTTDADGLPQWPIGWLGSISHSTVGAMAVVAQSKDVAFLGADMEMLMSSDVANEIRSLIATPNEMAYLAAADHEWSMTLLFSAKEALYKALCPIVRRFFDFSSARLTAWQPGCVRLELQEDWGPDFRGP